jgi:hypothetical protein
LKFNKSYPQVTKLYIVDFMKDIGTQYVWRLGVFFGLLVSGTASHSYSLTTNWKDTNFVTSNIYYFLNFDEAAKNTTNFFSEVDAGKGKALWDFHDKPFGNYSSFNHLKVKPGVYLTFPKIDTSVTFTLPRKDLEVKMNDQIFLHEGKQQVVYQIEDISQTNEVYENGLTTLENTDLNIFKKDEETKVLIEEEIIEKIESKKEQEISETVSDGEIDMETFYEMHKLLSKQLLDFESPDVNGRLISPYKIENTLKVDTKSDFPTFQILEGWWAKLIGTENKVEESKKGCVIFHIHGGGFVAMSTFGNFPSSN